MIINMYTLKNLLDSYFQQNNPNFECTKCTSSYFWITDKDFFLSGFPLHYEIRKDNKNNLHVELHYESQSIILHNGKDLKSEIIQLVINDIGLLPVYEPKNDGYLWFTKYKAGIEYNSESDILRIQNAFDELINSEYKINNSKKTLNQRLIELMDEIWR